VLPKDSESLRAMVLSLLAERDCERQRAEQQQRRAEESKRQAEELRVEMLRLQLELERFRKWYYGPRADRLQSSGDVAQMLLTFAEELVRKPVHPDDVPPAAEPAEELRRVRRCKGRRNLANFENLPVTTHVHELSAEERACPCCGRQRQEIGADESWQVEYYPARFERIQHLRKKYACPDCEAHGDGARIQTATKPEGAIDKGLAGPGLLAYIVTSKFSDYLPLYRLEDIFKRQGFEISRATQSVWCGGVADLVGPLYELMAERVRASHVVATDDTIMPMLARGKTANARMWVYAGDQANPYNVFDFTLNRGRDGPKYFLKDYKQILLADAYGGYNGVVAGNDITRAGCWAHLRRKVIEAEKAAPEIAREAIALVRALYAVEQRAKELSPAARLELRRNDSAPVLSDLREKILEPVS
jgi:transposase